MGSSSSAKRVEATHNPRADTNSANSRNSCGSIGSVSSGFHSTIGPLSCEEPVVSVQSAMEKRRIQTRPSLIVHTIEKQELEEEENMERKHIKQTPALKAVLQGFDDCRNALNDESKRTEDAFDQLCKMLETKVKKPFNTYGNDEQRLVMANKLERIGFVKLVTEYYEFVYEELDIVAVTGDFVEEAQEQDDPGFKLILCIREILWNFSDGSHRFSEELSKTVIIERLVVDLEKINEDGLQLMEEAGENLFAFSSAVGILHNCARNPDVDKKVFRDAKAVENLYPFLQSSLVYVKMITLLALGNMIKEDQVQDLQAGLDVFDFLMEAIREAMRAKDRKRHGFHLSELVDGLASLAQSDQNKKLIMLKNPLEMMQTILRSKNQPEVLAAIKLVWELAFLDENKEKIRDSKQLLQTLGDLKASRNDDIRKAALGAWFVISDMSKRAEGMPSTPSQPKGKHIMFSYCWGDKEMVYKIYRILNTEGFPIWLDINEMDKYGNVLEGMAKAVEEAEMILIFYSEKYKHSQNCRTEAEYAYNLKKPFIPIKLQRGYTPDGWLGILIGARLFVEFSDKYDFNVKMDELRRQLPKFDGPPPTTPVSPGGSGLPQIGPPVPQGKMLRDWKKEDVDKWAADNNLRNVLNKVNKLSPENLQFLHRVMTKAPETFYRWSEDKVQLKTLDDLMKFDTAIRNLQPFL